ncbi:MAG: c-type cytochrome [Rhodospirillales bacterium]|nr:c-type cytochrome [Rhodospirillales bacterium]
MTKGFFMALGMSMVFALTASPSFAGDAEKGEKVFKKRCKACHEAEVGKNKVGPFLSGVVGRKAGTADGFKRYKGLAGADWTWDEATLMEYLADPSAFAKARTGKATSMTFKLKKEDERADVIAYLKSK